MGSAVCGVCPPAPNPSRFLEGLGAGGQNPQPPSSLPRASQRASLDGRGSPGPLQMSKGRPDHPSLFGRKIAKNSDFLALYAGNAKKMPFSVTFKQQIVSDMQNRSICIGGRGALFEQKYSKMTSKSAPPFFAISLLLFFFAQCNAQFLQLTATCRGWASSISEFLFRCIGCFSDLCFFVFTTGGVII